MLLSPIALAQKTVEVDAGAGMKQELVYDASGQIVETRTIGADGKLQVRNIYTYPPGFYTGGKQTTTNYWPDGKSVQSVSTEDYDANGNFTEEVIAEYDQSGKHTRGHRLSHEPMTGIYRCWNWDGAAQKYKAIECPAAEEGGEAEAPKPLTLDQAMKQLAAAKQAARAQEKSARMEPKSPIHPSDANSAVEVGLVLPAQLAPGERASGTFVDNPAQFEGIPDLSVVRFALPSDAAEGTSLSKWTVEAPDMPAQPATGPVTFTVPKSAQEFAVTLHSLGDPAATVARTVKMSGKIADHAAQPSPKYKAAVLCVKNDICSVSGSFTGDSSKTFAAFGEVPAPIVAETSTTAYIGVPKEAINGPQYLLVTEGSKLLAFPIAVAELTTRADSWTLKKDGTSMVFITVAGPGDLAESQWTPGTFPAANLARAQALIPGFKPARHENEEHESREAHEKKSGHDSKQGFVLVVARNTAPDVVSFHDARNETYSFELVPGSFKTGDFVYKFYVQASHEGTYGVKGTIIPFLAPVAAQEFPLENNPASASAR